IKTLKEIKTLKNKRVLLRCDFNVPLRVSRRANAKPKVMDPAKIESALPTIQLLQKQGAIIIITSHLGRPNSHINGRGGLPSAQVKKELSLFPIADYLSKRLREEIIFVDNALDVSFAKHSKNLKPGQIVLLENIRFHPGEEKNSPTFSKKLASLADIYINEAFGVDHRDHASLTGITKFLPSYAGLNLEHEASVLGDVLKKPDHPALAIIGGSKIPTKLQVVENLARKFNLVVVGGAVANNFLKAIGYEVGKSVVDKKYLKQALKLLNHKTLGKKIIIPYDVRVATGIESPRKSTWRQIDQVKKDEYILDVGPRTARLYSKLAHHAKLVVWSGPLGLYENKHFNRGTYRLARALARSRATSIVGGGETINVLKRLRLIRKVDFVSTGGGAMLEFLAGNELPGLEILSKK
ncbi:phosphoglycerate kinase, partial [Candidatus Falkowbacteria bacterium]|nr:phosphoglycerate kinase [Candidatus Falkowbacteria bacterium]